MSLMLTVDDLGMLHRELGIWLPGFALDAEGVGEGRAEHGAITRADDHHRPGQARPSATRHASCLDDPDLDAVAVIVESFADAVLAVEVVTDKAGAVTEYAFSVGSSGEQSLMEALPRGMVRCAPVSGDAVSTVAGAAGISQVGRAAEGPVWTVDPIAYRRCDGLALDGDEDGAANVLVRAGVDEQTAKTWVATLCGRGSAAAITAVKRDPGTGRIEAGELRWLCGASGEAWRITADETSTLLTPVDGQQLLAALEDLCKGVRA